MTRLLIVRHAQAALPEDLRLPGPDLPLLPEGEKQARLLANRLLPCRPSAIYASDSRRARQTGEIIATTCDVELNLLPELRETDLGAWGGLTFAEVTELDPLAARWFSAPTVATPPHGEHVAAAAARVQAAFDTLAHSYREPIVIVGHSGSLRLALAQALGIPLSAYWRLRLDCASLSIVEWTEDGPIVERLNDVSHLATQRSPTPPTPLAQCAGQGGIWTREPKIVSGQVTLILGGARSGKSAYAERLAGESGRPVLYVATATAGDDEMAARIAAHRAQRPAGWHTIEAPENILRAIRDHSRPGDAILLDCLTLWVSNVMLREIGAADVDTIPSPQWTTIEASLVVEAQALIATARERDLTLFLVSNEVGMGVVPPFALGRRFQDILGRVNQAVAASSDSVILMIAGLPVDLRRLIREQP